MKLKNILLDQESSDEVIEMFTNLKGKDIISEILTESKNQIKNWNRKEMENFVKFLKLNETDEKIGFIQYVIDTYTYSIKNGEYDSNMNNNFTLFFTSFSKEIELINKLKI